MFRFYYVLSITDLFNVNFLINASNKTFLFQIAVVNIKDLLSGDPREYFGKLGHWELCLSSYV